MKVNLKTALVALILAAVFFCGLFAFCSFHGKYYFMSEPVLKQSAVNLEPKAERVYSNPRFCREALSSDLQREVYDIIYESVTDSSYSDELEFSTADKNDFHIALNAVLSDHPEIFWVDFSGYSYSEYDGYLSVRLNYTDEGEELAAKKDNLKSAVAQAVSEAPENANDYDMELFLNSWLAERVDYDSDDADKHSAYGALVEGKAVCDGYSHAFQLLCQNLSLDCAVIEGNSEFNQSTDDGHMWNCVRLGGGWYHIDVTWNDAKDAATSAERYFYFNLTDSEIAKDHTISGDYDHRSENKGNFFNVFLPKCESTEFNYLKRSLVTIKNPDDDNDILAALIAAARSKSDCCAYIIGSGDFDGVCENIINNCASGWIQGANHFLGGKVRISDSTRLVSYENKKILAFALKYE